MIEIQFIEDYSSKMLQFLTDKFTEVTVIEAVNTFFRFKIDRQVQLSELFGAIEPNVGSYNYSASKSLHFAV